MTKNTEPTLNITSSLEAGQRYGIPRFQITDEQGKPTVKFTGMHLDNMSMYGGNMGLARFVTFENGKPNRAFMIAEGQSGQPFLSELPGINKDPSFNPDTYLDMTQAAVDPVKMVNPLGNDLDGRRAMSLSMDLLDKFRLRETTPDVQEGVKDTLEKNGVGKVYDFLKKISVGSVSR